MKKLVLSALLLVSSASFANGVGVNVAETARPGVPQVRWTTIDVVPNGQGLGNFSYEIMDFQIVLKWTTNQGVKGECRVLHNENQENPTDWAGQVTKRKFHLYSAMLPTLVAGQKLFINSTFDNKAECSLNLSAKLGA